MPIRKRGTAWEVVVSHGGKKYRRSSRWWNRAAARQVERRLIDDLSRADAGIPPQRTFNQAVERWIKEELPTKKGQNKHRSMLLLIAPFMEGRPLTDGPDIAAQMRADYRAQDLSASTINGRMAVIRRLLSLSYRRWGWLEQPLHQRIRMLSLHNERHIYLTPPEVEALADACPHGHDAILLAAYTGIRRGQLLRLTAANRIGDCIHLGTEGKTGRPQLIPLHERIQNIRLPLSVTDAALRREWDAARAQLNLQHVHFHDLRHTFASWLLQAGADIIYLREFLGHSTLAVTQRYAHLQTTHLRAALNRVGSQNGHKP